MKLDDDIHNYYEHLVLERIAKLGLDKTKTADYLADLCCLALNQVPPRYIRFEVDMAFYLPQSERRQMEMNVEYAISKALRFLNDAEKNEKPHGPDSEDTESMNMETEASVNLAAEDLKNDQCNSIVVIVSALLSELTLSELALVGETKDVDSKELKTKKLTVKYWGEVWVAGLQPHPGT